MSLASKAIHLEVLLQCITTINVKIFIKKRKKSLFNQALYWVAIYHFLAEIIIFTTKTMFKLKIYLKLFKIHTKREHLINIYF